MRNRSGQREREGGGGRGRGGVADVLVEVSYAQEGEEAAPRHAEQSSSGEEKPLLTTGKQCTTMKFQC